MAINKRLFFLGEIALDGEEHAGESFAVSGHRRIIVFVKAGDAEEIAEKSLALKDISVVRELLVSGFVIVVLIVDVAHYFFQHILKRDNALSAAEFINDHSHVDVPAPEILKQVVNHARFGYEIGFPEEFLPLEIGFGLANVREKVARVEDTLNVVLRIFESRES